MRSFRQAKSPSVRCTWTADQEPPPRGVGMPASFTTGLLNDQVLKSYDRGASLSAAPGSRKSRPYRQFVFVMFGQLLWRGCRRSFVAATACGEIRSSDLHHR